MKKKMLLAMLAGVLSIAGYAQGKKNGGPCERLNKTYQFMKDSLALTADQDARILKINDSACAKFQSIRKNNAGNRDAAKAQGKLVMKETRDAWKAVLTPVQLKQLKAKYSKNKGDKMDPAKQAQRQTEKMKTELGLDAAQTEKVLAANLDRTNRMKALKAKKDAGADSSILKTEMKQIHHDYKAKMKEILTPVQFEKFQSMRKEKAGQKRKK